MANETGSGTLAGSAHQQSFDRLCAASARSISAAVNRQFCRPALAAAFPNQPPLVSFNLAPEKEDSRAASAQIIASLASAGFRPSPDTVAELMGFEVERVDIPSSPAAYREAPLQAPSVSNRQAEEEAPLSPSELSALQAFCRPLAADDLAADSPRFLSPLSAAVQSPQPDPDADPEIDPDADPEIDPDADPEIDPDADPDDVENKHCNGFAHFCDKDATGAALRHSHRAARTSGGNPRAKSTQSNTPLKAAPAASPQAKVKAVDHALKVTQKGGRNVHAAAYLGDKPLDVLGGSPATEGSSHAARHFKPGQTSRHELAKTIVLGQKKPDRSETASVRKGFKAILAENPKGGQTRSKLITTRPKLEKD